MSARSFSAGLLVSVAAASLGLGLAWLAGSQGHVWRGIPVVAWCAVLAFVLQWLAFVPAALLRTERFYDLMGTLSYLSVVGLAFASTTTVAPPGPRQWVIAALVSVWALRLGGFLVARIRRVGKDGRFDQMKRQPARFLVAWTVQGLWVTLTSLGALVLLTGRAAHGPLGPADWVGWLVWGVGFSIEVVADRQKSSFNDRPENEGRFVQVGLWRWSRHPNYFGEVLLWTGLCLSGVGVYVGTEWLALVSPVFVFLLLTRVSGIPLLEARAEARWGALPEYQAYKKATSVLLPRPPRP